MNLENINFMKQRLITSISPLLKGWSSDKKYILEDSKRNLFLLRVSDQSLFEKKRNQFELLKRVESLDILCSRPLEFGQMEDGKVYMVLSYLDGIDGEKAIQYLTDLEAYHLGIDAGIILRKLHSIPIPKQVKTWWDRYQEKMPGKIDALMKCGKRIPMQDEIICYYQEHCQLIKDRPLMFAHGDYHLGDMIVLNGKIGIIDFDKNNVSDPYDDLKPFCWNVMRSEYFETGLINGYFENNVPDNFFPILKFYAAESLISHLPWAMTFGEKEIATALKVADYQLQWYENFNLEIPTWYKGLIMVNDIYQRRTNHE